jgi:hypothetical protein
VAARSFAGAALSCLHGGFAPARLTRRPAPPHVSRVIETAGADAGDQEDETMTDDRNPGLFRRIASFFAMIRSANAAAAAVEAHRAPRARDLRRLGIEPAAFLRIGAA